MLRMVFFVFLAYFLLYEPLGGWWFFKRFVAEPFGGSPARIRYYKLLLVDIWVPSLLVLLLCLGGAIDPASLGVRLPRLDFSLFGPWVGWSILALVGVLCLLTVYQLVAARVSAATRQALQNTPLPPELAKMLPYSAPEKRLWLLLSLSAGLTEELLYRGFLLYLLANLFPGLGPYPGMFLAALLFGLGHSYQGPGGMLKTFLYGGLLLGLYMVTGSLLPGILLHFLTDLAARDMTPAAGAFENGDMG